ncbi:MAG: helix-turn-helix domain-containing protein [Candidatus Omnitrophica bacterium]|nr:helix-turn-helix domain-containing protein [Candidatus Omnitrophota bacterium]
MRNKIFSISKAAEYVGVFPLTLRNWEKEEKIKAFRTPGGHRRFKQNELDKITGDTKIKDMLRENIKKLKKISIQNEQAYGINNIIEDLQNISEEL